MSKLTDKITALHIDIRVFVQNADIDIALQGILVDVLELERRLHYVREHRNLLDDKLNAIEGTRGAQ